MHRSKAIGDAGAEPLARIVAGDGSTPNNPRCALLHYAGAVDLPARDPAAAFETLFRSHGWGGCWRNGIYDFLHFHTTAHEVLGVYRGGARVRLGGERGIDVELGAGDVVVIPAGVGHRKLASRGGFAVVGAYPEGQHPDLCEPEPALYGARVQRVAAVPLPRQDPVLGADGPLLRQWRAGGG